MHDAVIAPVRGSTSVRGERGAAAIIMALFVGALMIPLAAVTVDIARWWVEAERIQAAADAASTAGATHMPEDFVKAKARALEIAEDNGYRNGVNSTIDVEVGDRPTQLRVTIRGTVDNFFGTMIGFDTSSVARGAMADFTGPAPMGSPCNTFANEPPGTTASGFGPVNSQIKAPTHAVCSNSPQFWASMSGPEVYKGQGSQFDVRKCGGGEDGCAHGGNGAKNDEYDPRGLVYMVTVGEQAVGKELTLQLFDPAYAPAGSALCANSPTGSTSLTNNFNSYVNDGVARYATGVGTFCVGDDPSQGNRFGSSEVPVVTSFGLREPVDTLNPFQGAPMPQCVRQFPGYKTSDITRANLKKATSPSGTTKSVNDPLSRVFRQWVTLCKFRPAKVGDYYLQVRTNVKLAGAIDSDTGASTNNMNVFNQTGDDTTILGNGINNFALRVFGANGDVPAGGVSVAAWERMRMFVNANSATTTFNLVRVNPAAATKTLVVTYFDVGEGATNGSVRLIKPTDATGLPATLSGCTGEGPKNGALTNCQVTNISSSTNNGRLQRIRVPIPNTYDCDATSAGGCWWRVEVKFGAGTVNDSTTWTARISGEPVRLIE